ncbi:F-box protein At3g07870-like [Quercus lobata]|uniref:F-box protein At3g07870-like n=1 Tax=Quercus lobata TaxID=97700 RepID=UPI0012458C46|nr:F-box protein At3g07870-like [Quercus lobata]
MAQFDRSKSLVNNNSNDNNNGYMLNIPPLYRKEFCTAVYNSDRTFTEISRFRAPCYFGVAGCCRCMFYFVHELEYKLFMDFAYHYQNNDYKILRIIFYRQNVKPKPAEAEIYTLSTDSWRRVVISVESSSGSKPIESVHYELKGPPCFVFFNGALHCIARSQGHKFIMYFDVNDERFREILLPQNYFDGLISRYSQHLSVFKGLLALIVFDGNSKICHIWMMKEYGVAESWIKKSVPMKEDLWF